MTKLQLLIASTLIVLLNSCNNGKSLVGVYSYRNSSYSPFLELKEDSTFRYSWGAGLLRGSSNGKWSVKGSEVILDSELQPFSNDLERVSVITSNDPKKNSLTISFMDSEKNTLPFITCWVKTDQVMRVFQANIDGRVEFKSDLYDSLIFSSAELNLGRIALKLEEEYNSFEITIIDRDENYVYFTGTNYQIRNRKLIRKGEKFVKNDTYK